MGECYFHYYTYLKCNNDVYFCKKTIKTGKTFIRIYSLFLSCFYTWNSFKYVCFCGNDSYKYHITVIYAEYVALFSVTIRTRFITWRYINGGDEPSYWIFI